MVGTIRNSENSVVSKDYAQVDESKFEAVAKTIG